ncbi:MAG TPA: sulfatase [Thermoanaerobaculia bacterium]|nr:sulfatase [Thermoanaerobaculia bacterium]
MLRTRAVVSLAFLTLILACRRSAPAFDFAANLDQASLTPETSRIDFGTSDGRRFLLEGWSIDETWADSVTTAVWGVGSSSRLFFQHFGSGELTLAFRCVPIWFDARQQSIRFIVNGTPLDRIPLGAGFQTYQLTVPRAALRKGANELRIEYAITQLNAPAGRQLAVAWDWMTFSVAPAAKAVRDGDTIRLPARSQLTYLVPVAPRCAIKLDRIYSAGEASLRIAVGRSDAVLPAVHILGKERDVEIALPVQRAALTQIDFMTGDRDVKLIHPRIECANAGVPPAGPAPSQRRPNVLIYLVDTLRADHLGVYGYARPTSPHIDAFARDSVVFTNAIAQSSWTKTSVASVLTGLVPFHHGTVDRDDALPPSIPTLPMMLAGAGYARYAAVANGNVSPAFGLHRGFESYRYLASGEYEAGAIGGVVVDAWQQWLAARRGAQPWFAYLHTIDPHDPYSAPEPFASHFGRSRIPITSVGEIAAFLLAHRDASTEQLGADIINKYDAEIVYTDAMFGRAIEDLKRRGLYDDTLIIFTSDHGEEFFDHGGWGHGHSLYRELLHVPLIVKFPGNQHAGTVVETNVQHVDIVPTVLQAAGVAIPKNLDGMPLMAVPDAPERRIASYLRMDRNDVMSAIYGQRQYLVNTTTGTPVEMLLRFAPSSTDRERMVLAQTDVWRRDLRRTLVRLRQESRRITVPQVPLEGELAKQLRALGYLR